MGTAAEEKYRGLQIFDELDVEEASELIGDIAHQNSNLTSSVERLSRADFIAQMKFGNDLVKHLQEKQDRSFTSRTVPKKMPNIYKRKNETSNKEKVENVERSVDEIPENDEISEEERILAQRLKDVCNANGEERRETLNQSASIIFEMGKFYMRKSVDTKGMRKKLNLLKSATLLHGAKVRFEQLKDSHNPQESIVALDKLKEIDSALVEFNGILLASLSDRGECESLLHEVSYKYSKKLKVLRDGISAKLKKLFQIPEGSSHKELPRERKRKIDEVRSLCKETTDDYVKLMQDIALDCLAVMGDPPCKFALAGLGSMAREEITLYSDFEHVIVLDDKAEELNYRKIKEFFRWFAVVFQVIIIGLGETFIRSIGVKSINDLTSKKRSENWFIDKYTPVGVSFDGMVPHSCNNPLGRQELTEKLRHVVELIQPATKMAKFLTREEELKNGYYLKDVLTGTCFVFGYQDVFNCFETIARQILNDEGMNGRIAEQLTKIAINRNDIVRGSHVLQNPARNYDFKATTYRPITALLAYLARICNIREKSSFDVVDRLHNLGVLDSEWTDALNFTAAVANEARMRVYLSKDGQRNASTPQDVVAMIGKTAAKYTYMVIHNLVGEITDVKTDGSKIAPFKPMDSCAPLDDWDLEATLNFGFFEEAVMKASSNIQKILNAWESEKLPSALGANRNLCRNLHILQQSFMALAHKNIERRYDYWRKTEWACTRILKLKPANITLEFLSHANLAMLYFYQLRSKEGVEETTKWFKLYCKYDFKDGMTARNVPFMRFIDILMREDVMNDNALIAHLMSVLANVKLETGEKFFVEIGIASAQLRKGNKEKKYRLFCEGKERLSEITLEIKQQAASMSRTVYQALLETIRDIQEKSVIHQHLLQTAETLSQTQEDDYAREFNFLTAEARQIKVVGANIAAHADDHEYCAKYLAKLSPQLRSPFEPALAAMLSQDVFATSSYSKMKSVLDETMKLFKSCMKKMENDSRANPIAKIYGVSMMALFESSSTNNIRDVVAIYADSPNKVKYFGPLQPMVYGFISAVLRSGNASQAAERDLAIQMQLSQRPIMKSLVLIQGFSRFHKVFNLAVDSFSLLRFQDCASILWKILTRRGRLVKNCIHLLNAVIVAKIMAHKLQQPRRYIRKLREISHSQLIEASQMSGNKFTKIMGLRFRHIHILHGKGLLVQAHNLAVDCHPISVKQCAKLLWMIVNCKTSSKSRRVTKESARCLLHVTYIEYIYHLPPNKRNRQTKGRA